MKKLLIIFFLFGAVHYAGATHNRAGEITFTHIGGLTYEILITTYTEPSSVSADRCSLDVFFGDGDMATVTRSNGPKGTTCDSGVGEGEQINSYTKVNKYRVQHTYAGPGSYVVSMTDPNRVANIENIPISVETPFSIRSVLTITPGVAHNNSPELQNLPIDRGCVNFPFYHNPGAVDIEGDSLGYSIVDCYVNDKDPISGYVKPDQILPGPDNNLSIGADGTLEWDSPQKAGEYNVCVLIEEYREGPGGNMVKISEVVRDMQVRIGNCDNEPPVFDPIPDACVIAGDSVRRQVVARDTGDVITLTAVGRPFDVPVSPAVFNQNVNAKDSVKETFYWETICEHIRKTPYQVTFKARDNQHITELVNFETFQIRVIGPPSTAQSAQAQGNSIRVQWTENPCGNATGYKIYRRIDSLGYVPDSCSPGVPPSTGYVLAGENEGYSNTIFFDDNDGQGLIHGHRYCYMITAVYPDGAESLPTTEICAELKKDVPVITRVSVNSTSTEFGSDTIAWAKPTEIDDTVQFTGPYRYKIFRKVVGGAEEQVGETQPKSTLQVADTVWEDFNLNTEEQQYQYRVELYSDTDLVGSTHNATSPFLEIGPGDEILVLDLLADVPWTNESYEIYKYNEDSAGFELIDTSYTSTYVDSGLKNGVEYCYKIKTIGSYSTDGFIDPIINWSQEQCGIPKDTVAPCNPPLSLIEGDCDLDKTYLSWENPNNSCADDVAFYRIYHTPQLGGEYEMIYETVGTEQTEYERFSEYSIAGCYTVTSIDSSGNESQLGEKFCVDNCPEYRLPNVFTPGGDGFNDYFVPFPYKYVESIDLKIYNRWGKLVFETTDPDIRWDGTSRETGKPCPAGVYYYVCTVNEIRLRGIEPRQIKGNVTILPQDRKTPPSN